MKCKLLKPRMAFKHPRIRIPKFDESGNIYRSGLEPFPRVKLDLGPLQTTGSLRSYDGCCNENVTLDSVGYSMLVTLYKMIEVHFRLPGTIDFHVKAKNESCTAPRSSFRQDLKYENFMSSLGRLHQNNVLKGGPHVQHDYFSSLNQSNH